MEILRKISIVILCVIAIVLGTAFCIFNAVDRKLLEPEEYKSIFNRHEVYKWAANIIRNNISPHVQDNPQEYSSLLPVPDSLKKYIVQAVTEEWLRENTEKVVEGVFLNIKNTEKPLPEIELGSLKRNFAKIISEDMVDGYEGIDPEKKEIYREMVEKGIMDSVELPDSISLERLVRENSDVKNSIDIVRAGYQTYRIIRDRVGVLLVVLLLMIVTLSKNIKGILLSVSFCMLTAGFSGTLICLAFTGIFMMSSFSSLLPDFINAETLYNIVKDLGFAFSGTFLGNSFAAAGLGIVLLLFAILPQKNLEDLRKIPVAFNSIARVTILVAAVVLACAAIVNTVSSVGSLL